MTNTGYARTMASIDDARRLRRERHASSTDWEPLAEFGPWTPPSDQPWHVAAYCEADVDTGSVGQLRLRSSAASAVTPGVTVASYSRNVRLGFQGVANTAQTIYVEGRRVSGTGGVRLVDASLSAVSAPPVDLVVGGIPVGGGLAEVVPLVAVGGSAGQQTITSPSFSPPANHRLVVVARAERGNHATAFTWSVADTGSLGTWQDDGASAVEPSSGNLFARAICVRSISVGPTPPTGITVTVDAWAGTSVGVYALAVFAVPNPGAAWLNQAAAFGYSGTSSVTCTAGAAVTGRPVAVFFHESSDVASWAATADEWTARSQSAAGNVGTTINAANVMSGTSVTQASTSASPFCTHGVLLDIKPSADVPTLEYAWEQRPSYVEPNPAGLAGSAGKVLADSLGLLRRVVVNSAPSLAAAKAAALPGDQIYVTATITGAGTDRVLDWAATDPSGTSTNPIMITTAPGVWLDGGQAAGAEDLNSRGTYIVGTDHIWLYGCNLRRANFLCMFNQCNGTAGSPIRVWYCTFQDSGHAMLNIAGNFGSGGSSSYFDVRYNTFDNSGLANQMFGEAVYIGYGSTNSPTLQPNNHITVEANFFTRLTAEACDIKAGSQYVFFRYNLIQDCADHASPARTGDAANIGFPGAVQFPGHTTPASGWEAHSEIIGNRWKNITSSSTKYPDGLVLVGCRGWKVAGNLFTEINVGSAGLIVFYLDGNIPYAPGDTGTVEVHNNTARDCNSMNALYRVTNAGTSQPSLLAVMNANSNHSNNVRANSPSAATGADYSVTDAAFVADGTGYSGSFSAPAPGGALDVTGADTTAHWSEDYAGQTVAVPVKPGAYQ